MACSPEIARANGKKGGRPKHTSSIKAEEARKYMVQRITEELEPILTAQIEAAKGMWIDSGEEKVFQQKPDIQAGKNLLDQLVGKAKETIEVESTTKLLIDE